ncbi:proton-coupled amino acid transporter 4-like [Diaphorina citri]|uniref:Proton-coupled amino acid transporter 4-like n=1 Tax=Diaphorina citri TaxID=121845 RepID=A0A3Q0JEZ3_DIACI|nr:proton-coupled amino acid transporter 4-like [Diaphorina citri]
MSFLTCLPFVCPLQVVNSQKLHAKLKLDEFPGFSDTMELSFLTGPRQFQRFTDTIRRLVKMFVIITQLGFCCVYFVFVAQSSHQKAVASCTKYFNSITTSTKAKPFGVFQLFQACYVEIHCIIVICHCVSAFQQFILALVVVGSIGFGILCTYSLQFYVPVAIIWAELEEKYGPFKHPAFGETILRVSLVLLTFILAAVIPRLGLFISLVGAISSTGLALIFPPLSDIAVRKKEGDFGRFHWRLLMDILTIILGLIGFTTGTYASVHEIITVFAADLNS